MRQQGCKKEVSGNFSEFSLCWLWKNSAKPFGWSGKFHWVQTSGSRNQLILVDKLNCLFATHQSVASKCGCGCKEVSCLFCLHNSRKPSRGFRTNGFCLDIFFPIRWAQKGWNWTEPRVKTWNWIINCLHRNEMLPSRNVPQWLHHKFIRNKVSR